MFYLYFKKWTTNKIFTKVNFKRHIRIIHTNKDKFQCFSCLRKFNDARYLKKHIARIHEGRQDFQCESCPKAFSLRDELTKHLKKVHKNSEESVN